MPEVVKCDFADKEAMLKRLDEVRELVESGQLTGFAVTGIVPGGSGYFAKSVWHEQKLQLIGMMEVHKAGVMSELLCEKYASELGI